MPPEKTRPFTVVPSSFRNARTSVGEEPKKPAFVKVPLRVVVQVLPVSDDVVVVPFDSVSVAVDGAQLTVIVPSSESPSLSVNVCVCAADQFVEIDALKCPFGWSLPATMEPVAV